MSNKQTSVQALMLFQSPLFSKASPTVRAPEWLFAFVSPGMTFPSIFVQERLPTKFTFPRSFSGVSFHMKFKL